MLKRINFLVSYFIPQKLYWYLAGVIRPWESVLENYPQKKNFYKDGEQITSILKKLKLINKKSLVLDIGCGVGRVEYSLSKEVGGIWGIDISPSMIKLAQVNIEAKNVKFRTISGQDLKIFPDNKFDLVFSIIVFQHLPKKLFINYLLESLRVLKKSGMLFFQIPISAHTFPNFSNHPWAVRRYTIEELKSLLGDFTETKFLSIPGKKLKGNEDQIWVQAKK